MAVLLTTDEVGELLHMSAESVRDLVAEGRLCAVRVRPKGRLLFDEADVRSALRSVGCPAIQASGGE